MFYCLERPSWLVSCIRLYKRGEFEIADWEILTFKLRTNDNYFSDLEAPSVFLGGLPRISRMRCHVGLITLYSVQTLTLDKFLIQEVWIKHQR